MNRTPCYRGLQLEPSGEELNRNPSMKGRQEECNAIRAQGTACAMQQLCQRKAMHCQGAPANPCPIFQ
eukprot:1256892-Pyramimonas_sp.AAC.1